MKWANITYDGNVWKALEQTRFESDFAGFVTCTYILTSSKSSDADKAYAKALLDEYEVELLKKRLVK